MSRPHTLLFTLWLAVVCLGSAAASSPSSDGAFKVIVHPSNPAASVSRAFMRDAYLRHQTSWSHGAKIRPIDLVTTFAARVQFMREILKKSPEQLKNYWIQRIFSGTGAPPPEAESTTAVIAYVLANPGALAYLPPDAAAGGAKVVTLH